MPKYKIQKTDILKDKKVHPEGSEIELTKEEAEVLADFLIPIEETKATKSETETKKTTKKSTSKKEEEPVTTEDEALAETDKTEGTKTDGGTK